MRHTTLCDNHGHVALCAICDHARECDINSFIHVTLRGIQVHVKLILFVYVMRFLLRCAVHYRTKGYFAQSCISFSADSAEQTVLCVVKKCAGWYRYVQVLCTCPWSAYSSLRPWTLFVNASFCIQPLETNASFCNQPLDTYITEHGGRRSVWLIRIKTGVWLTFNSGRMIGWYWTFLSSFSCWNV